jgi:hypothetical protein
MCILDPKALFASGNIGLIFFEYVSSSLSGALAGIIISLLR